MESMTPVLDDLLNDGRLARLFSEEARHCALQLWILQIKYGQSIENRLVYGRLLPYNHSNNSWSASDDDNFDSYGQVQAQVIRFNLYIESAQCANLLRQLSAGQTIAEISKEQNLDLSDKLKERFGATVLAADKLVYRPVAYLLNRDAHDHHSPSSPHGSGGAFSASITQSDKRALFRLGQDYDSTLTASVIRQLNEDTGLDFGGADTARFGDFELLVFPTLDDRERPLLTVSWADDRGAYVVRFNPMQVPYFSGFQFRLSIANDGQIFYSSIDMAERDEDGIFECIFNLGDQLRSRTDSTELEIFGFPEGHSTYCTLCCRWRVGYIREISLQSHVVSHAASSIKFDWLEKTTRQSVSARTKAALTINRGNQGFTNRVVGREADPWVPANHDLVSLFARLHPPKSEGQFFQRWSKGDQGRLQFVEWFKALLGKYQQHAIAIFDPYFDSAGLGLVLLCAAQEADYIVFTSLPKQSKEGEATPGESDNQTWSRINNLVASCESNRQLLNRIKLRIYGLKEGRLHDRYILIMGPDRLPVAGFNLSNSFQKAAENYPLLVTPIPADVLLMVEQYKLSLVQEMGGRQPDGETENPSMRALFDSTVVALQMVPRRYERLSFLEKPRAGDVLGVWTGKTSLIGLSGDRLKEQMVVLNLLKDGSLTLPEEPGLRNCLDSQSGNFADFTSTWEVLGDVLAHSRFGDYRFHELEFDRDFLEFLACFVDASFNRAYDEGDKELAVTDYRLFRESLDALLYSSYHPQQLFHSTKYAALTWSEYFAIKFLWMYSPDTLLAIAEAKIACVPMEPQASDAVCLSQLSQIVSEVSLSIQFDISDFQRNCLVLSSNGFLRWMGLNAIEGQLEKPGGLTTALQLLSKFTYQEQVRTLGWMVQHVAENQQKVDIYKDLVAALHKVMPVKILADELQCLVDSMRGHMRQLAWAEPWLFRDVVFPLLQNKRASNDDACEIWVLELASMLEPQMKNQSLLFDLAREGQTTNIAALLFAGSSPERQKVGLKAMQTILNRQKRIVQQPLASTSDWIRWDRALTVSLWILAFSKWGEYYLRQYKMNVTELDQLSRDARELATARPMNEWRSEGAGKLGQLAVFLDQVEGLLASSDDSICKAD